jgi:hypothetical protein
MTDDALISWLSSGAQVRLTPEEEAARRASEYARRFHAALNPADDLGETHEAHEAAVASNVYAVHAELSAFGIDAYDAVWLTLAAPVRRAIKAYVAVGKP